MFEVTVQNGHVLAVLRQLSHAEHQMSPVMARVAAVLQSHTTANFAAGGRPRWQPKTDGTPATLRKSGHLRGSVTAGSSSDAAWVSSNLPYSAIHQLGGTAGRGAVIPARPYMPMLADGSLQPEAAEDVMDQIEAGLRRMLA